MHRRIDDDIHLGKTVTPFESIGESRVIYRTVSSFDNANEKVQKIKRLIKTGEYYEDVARHITGVMNVMFQEMLKT